MSRVVAIDLGSNTFRALLFDCKRGEVIASYEKTVRLAHKLSSSNVICEQALQRVKKAAASMPPAFKELPVKAVTTQAMRIANNKDAALEFFKQECGIDFEIIDGIEEGRLTCKGVKNRLRLLHKEVDDFVIVDIGGGSTEVIFYNKGAINVKSFAIGIVTAAEKGIEAFEDQFKAAQKFCNQNSFERFISTAGTATTVAALKLGYNYQTYDSRAINATTLQPKDLESTLQQLLDADKAKRQELVGVWRDDLIINGIAIYKRFFEILKSETSMVIDDGLREGVALTLCKR